MNVIRVILLILYAVIMSRSINEGSGCINDQGICAYINALIILFAISTYFLDSFITELDIMKKKLDAKYVLVAIPYFLYVLLVVNIFFTSFTMVSMEYIISKYLLYACAFYIAVFGINNFKKIRKFNKVLMVTTFLAFAIFLIT